MYPSTEGLTIALLLVSLVCVHVKGYCSDLWKVVKVARVGSEVFPDQSVFPSPPPMFVLM